MRYALRFWLRSGRFDALWMTTVLAIAVAIGTASWSIASGLWLEPPPFAQPDRLVLVGWMGQSDGRAVRITSPDEYVDLKAASQDFLDLAGYESAASIYLNRGDRMAAVATAYVTTNLFDTLGVTSVYGRTFVPADAEAVAGVPRAVITERLWREALGTDPAILGSLLSVSADATTRSVEVIGVIPTDASIRTLGRSRDLMDLLIAAPDGRRPGGTATRRAYDRAVVGRLKHDVTLTTAEQRLTPIFQQIDRDYPLFDRIRSADVVSLQEAWFGDSRPFLWLLIAATGLVVLVAAANAAGLMALVVSRREQESAVRAALGADRWRITRQTLAEVGALAVVSWLVGVALAAGITGVFAATAPADIPRIADLGVDWRGWLLGAGFAAAFCLLLGTLPGWINRGQDLRNGLQSSGLASTPPRRNLRLRQAALAAQMALVLALLASAGLVSATLWRLLSQPLGFDPAGVVVAEVRPTAPYFLDRSLYQEVMDTIRKEVSAAPGQRTVALTFDPPLADTLSRSQVRFLHRSPEFVTTKLVTDGYFDLMQVDLLAGRDFTMADFSGPPHVVVNERFATSYFGGLGQALGQEFDFGPRHRIIGVVANVREGGLAEPVEPVVYPLLVTSLRTPGRFYVVSREHDATAVSLRVVEDAVRAADPTLHVRASLLTDRVRTQTATARTQSRALAGLALVTLLLAVLGVYATVGQMVADRKREMAIRSALGASPGGLVWLAVRTVSVALVAGVLAGALLSGLVAQVTRRFLFDVSPFDPFVWGGAVALLLCAAGLAVWIPSRRAGRTHPILALRDG